MPCVCQVSCSAVCQTTPFSKLRRTVLRHRKCGEWPEFTMHETVPPTIPECQTLRCHMQLILYRGATAHFAQSHLEGEGGGINGYSPISSGSAPIRVGSKIRACLASPTCFPTYFHNFFRGILNNIKKLITPQRNIILKLPGLILVGEL